MEISHGLFVLVLFFFYSYILLRSKKHKTPPMAPGASPILGHLHLFERGSKLPHVQLGDLADKCGPIYTIRLGMHRAVVVSSPETVKECCTTHDADMMSRTEFAAAKYLAYNYAMFVFTPHGPYWREMRKLAAEEILSNRRIELLRHVRASEVEMSIKDLYKRSSGGTVLVDLREFFDNMSLNIILRMVAGKRYDVKKNGAGEEREKRQFQVAMKEFFELMGLPVASDAFPISEWLDIGGHIKKMKRTAKNLDSILNKWLEEHRRKKVSDDDQQDFMDVMISEIGSKDILFGYDVDTIIKATSLTMIAGSTNTSSVTIILAISLLLNNPRTLEKAQQELLTVIGTGRFASESDIENLVYLKAVVKETLRMYPPGRLLVPRVLTKDCIVSGYHISKGTRVIPNIWKIQNDPKVWSDPSEFKPERFVTTHKDIDVRGQHFELLPFGSGRRGCPGISFGLRVMHLALASFLHAFEVSTLDGAKVDMTEGFGLTNVRATLVQVLVKPCINVV